MSILAAGERSGARPAPNRPRRPQIHQVPKAATRPARAPFVVLVLVTLSLGLGLLLLLNTLLAQGSFTLYTLDAKVADLADREQALRQRTAELAAPQRLARNAARIGLVPAANPAFLRAEDGKILGEPMPAPGPVSVVGSEADPVAGADAPSTAAQPATGPAQETPTGGGGDR